MLSSIPPFLHLLTRGLIEWIRQKYLSNMRRPSPSDQTWSIFLRNHAPNIWACDFVQVYDISMT